MAYWAKHGSGGSGNRGGNRGGNRRGGIEKKGKGK